MAQEDMGMTIRQLREGSGWSQVELAARLGVNASNITRWERGVVQPSRGYLLGLARLFRVSIEELALGPGEQRPDAGTRQARPEARQHG